jgi:predicted PurR-regulated permease PerM
MTWAVALAVVAHPLHAWIASRIDHRTLAAALSVVIVTAMVMLPFAFVAQQLAQETSAIFDRLKADGGASAWQAMKASAGVLGPMFDWLDRQWSVKGQVESVSEAALAGVKAVWSASVGVVIGGLVTLFFLFYFFRDRQRLIGCVRTILPLSAEESAGVLQRIADTIHAMIFGSLGVALIQGALGGLMFWLLGLPSPLVWAAVMSVCAILPVMGAALVWVPAAIYLWVTGDSMRALAMVGWGIVVISLIDNVLYPVLVKNRLRMHTIPVFVAIVGGIALFGAAGLVLGPVVLAVTLALLGIWRNRMRIREV